MSNTLPPSQLSRCEVQDREDDAHRQRDDEEHGAPDERQHLPRWALILRTGMCERAVATATRDAVANL